MEKWVCSDQPGRLAVAKTSTELSQPLAEWFICQNLHAETHLSVTCSQEFRWQSLTVFQKVKLKIVGVCFVVVVVFFCCFLFFFLGGGGGGEGLIQLTLNSVLLLLYMQGTRSCTECHSWLACISRDLLIRRVSSVLSTPPPPLSFCLPTDYRRTWERGLTIASIEHSVNDLDPLSV